MRRVLVTRVVDGDTVIVTTVDDGKTDIRLRLYGIDAPESTQPYGAEATRALIEMLRPHSYLFMQVHGSTYGRILASLYTHDDYAVDPRESNICYRLVREGWAWYYSPELKKGKKRNSWGIPRPPLSEFAWAEHLARSERLGLWKQEYAGAPILPHTYRHLKKERRQELIAYWKTLPAYRPLPRYRRKQ